ncbi:hypothetical protein QJQ45_001192 [Haematococcus lacustris]|nr:hypothetical protein QJQ45_001192 [Haematococcus lacustris]
MRYRIAAVTAAGVFAQPTGIVRAPSPPILAPRPPTPSLSTPPPQLSNAAGNPLLITLYGLDLWSLLTSWGSGIQALLEAQPSPSLSLQDLSAPGMCASQLLALNTTALLNTSLTAQELMPGLGYFAMDVAQLLRDYLNDSSIAVQVADFCAGNRTVAPFIDNRTLVNGPWPTLNVTIGFITNEPERRLSIMDADLEPPAPALDPPPAQSHEQEEIVEEPLPADPDLEQVPGGSEMDVMAAERKSLGMLMHDQMLGAFDLKCVPGQDGGKWSKRPQGHFRYDPSLPGADRARLAKLMTDLQAKQVAHHASDAHTTAMLELLASTSTVPNIPASASAMRTAMEQLGQPQEEYLVYDMCPCGHIYRGPLAQHADSCRCCSKPRTSALELKYRPVRQWLQRMYAYPALAEQLTLWRDLRAEYTRDSHTMSDAWHSPAFERVRHGDGTAETGLVPMSLSFDSFQPHKDDAKYSTTAFVLAPLTVAAEHRSVPGVSHLVCLMPGAKERGEKQSIVDALLLIVEDLLSLDGALEVHNSYLEESRRVKPILACIRGDYRGLALAMGSNQKQSPARYPCFLTWLEGKRHGKYKTLYQTHQQFLAEHDQWLKEELCGVKLPVPDTNGIRKRHPKEVHQNVQLIQLAMLICFVVRCRSDGDGKVPTGLDQIQPLITALQQREGLATQDATIFAVPTLNDKKFPIMGTNATPEQVRIASGVAATPW